jgi:hypothetical protein
MGGSIFAMIESLSRTALRQFELQAPVGQTSADLSVGGNVEIQVPLDLNKTGSRYRKISPFL